LIAKAFLPPPEASQDEVRHLDGDKTNNAIENLAWGTRKENGEDMARHGSLKGRKNPRAVLTESDIIAIRWANVVGDTFVEIARRFRVSVSTIEAVISGRNWGHVSNEIEAKRDEYGRIYFDQPSA
jgi:DNA-binding LacI/PurR family transcriptional regulator